MNERRAVPILVLGLGLAAVAGLGLFLGIGSSVPMTALAVVGVVLSLGVLHRMARLPEDREAP
jgi:hypothetical protein